MNFPSPARDEEERVLDLNTHLVHHPTATFFIYAENTNPKTGINQDDLLIVDRSLTPHYGQLVVAITDGSFDIRRLEHTSIDPETEELLIWGVVTHIIRKS